METGRVLGGVWMGEGTRVGMIVPVVGGVVWVVVGARVLALVVLVVVGTWVLALVVEVVDRAA